MLDYDLLHFWEDEIYSSLKEEEWTKQFSDMLPKIIWIIKIVSPFMGEYSTCASNIYWVISVIYAI